MPVVTVTDSAARLPRNLLQSLGIRVVPLHILLDGHDLRDGVDELPADLYQREAGTAGAAPANSRPPMKRPSPTAWGPAW